MRNKAICLAIGVLPDGTYEALVAEFPAATPKTCIKHLIRNNLNLSSWKERKLLAAALEPICHASRAKATDQVLSDFEHGPWGRYFQTTVAAWHQNLGPGDPILCPPAKHTPADQHRQCHPESAQSVAQDHQD